MEHYITHAQYISEIKAGREMNRIGSPENAALGVRITWVGGIYIPHLAGHHQNIRVRVDGSEGGAKVRKKILDRENAPMPQKPRPYLRIHQRRKIHRALVRLHVLDILIDVAHTVGRRLSQIAYKYARIPAHVIRVIRAQDRHPNQELRTVRTYLASA